MDNDLAFMQCPGGRREIKESEESEDIVAAVVNEFEEKFTTYA
jgi:hypothetical protein